MNRNIVVFSGLAIGLALLLARFASLNGSVQAEDQQKAAGTLVPIDVSMHYFMEGLFQQPFRRLKPAMIAEPTDKPGWKILRSESLIMAEGSNLLLLHKPEKDSDKWVEYSLATRDRGVEMNAAATRKDFAGAKKAYEAMVVQCNACHKHFDDGKNQLEP